VGGTGESWNKTNLKTRDRLLAIFRFRDWVRQQSPDVVTLVDRQPPTLDGKPLEYNDASGSYVLPPDAFPDGGGTSTATLPNTAWSVSFSTAASRTSESRSRTATSARTA